MSRTPEAIADDMEDAAAAMAGRLVQLATVRGKTMDSRALFLAMSRTLESMGSAAQELARQGWVTPGEVKQDGERWDIVLKWLDTASGFFEEVANGWI